MGLASLLIYFLMVGLDKSFVVPLSVMSIVPLCLIGILPMLYLTGSAVNVQSLLGFIFIVGIKVANSVLMTDYAQELRRHEGLTPFQAIRKAASLRVRPITMTALAAFFALIPGAMAIERGSEANAPLARAILGGLLAGEPATLFVLPVIYTLIVRDSPKQRAERAARRRLRRQRLTILSLTAAGTNTKRAAKRSRPCEGQVSPRCQRIHARAHRGQWRRARARSQRFVAFARRFDCVNGRTMTQTLNSTPSAAWPLETPFGSGRDRVSFTKVSVAASRTPPVWPFER